MTTNQLDPTPAEGRLAQAYVETMDFISRCVQAMDQGNWAYLADKTGQLGARVAALEIAADVAATADPPPRPDAVKSAVITRGAHYRAVAVLHADTVAVAGEGTPR